MIKGMRVGYFKVKPALPAVRPKRELARLSSTRSVAKRSNRSLVPVAGFLLALALITGLQVGAWLSSPVNQVLAQIHWQPPMENYRTITNITLPASVSLPIFQLATIVQTQASISFDKLEQVWTNYFSSANGEINLPDNNSSEIINPVFQ